MADRHYSTDSEEVFSDPFAADAVDDYDPVPMTAADYGLSSSASPVSGGSSSPFGSGGSALGSAASVGGKSVSGSYGHLSGMDVAAAMSASTMALPAIGAAAASHKPALLAHERRSLWGAASYNIGYAYFGGLFLGGLAGLSSGLKSSPNMRPRVLLNSILNGCGRYGAKTGNAAGMLALTYTVLERQLEDVEVDALPGKLNNLLGSDLFPRSRWDGLIPAATAFTTGVLFTLPKAITMSGIERHLVTPGKRVAVVMSGGVLTLAGVSALQLVASQLFDGRFSFA